MPARGYEFLSSSVQLDISRVSAVYYINTSEKGTIYYVTITTVISLHVKIKCYFHL